VIRTSSAMLNTAPLCGVVRDGRAGPLSAVLLCHAASALWISKTSASYCSRGAPGDARRHFGARRAKGQLCKLFAMQVLVRLITTMYDIISQAAN
jgi:hypothetical protein